MDIRLHVTCWVTESPTHKFLLLQLKKALENSQQHGHKYDILFSAAHKILASTSNVALAKLILKSPLEYHKQTLPCAWFQIPSSCCLVWSQEVYLFSLHAPFPCAEVFVDWQLYHCIALFRPLTGEPVHCSESNCAQYLILPTFCSFTQSVSLFTTVA